MSLKYALTENRLATAQPDEYVARPQDVHSHDMDSITEQMLEKGSTVTKADILAVLNNFFEVAHSITASGETINTDLFKTNLSISGVFEGAAAGFEKKQHSIKVNLNPGKVLKEALAKIHTEKVDSPEPIPHILEVKDSISGSINDHITSQGIVEIIGSLLKIEGDSPQNGVSLTDSTGTAHKITTIAANKPSMLFILLPQLAKGEYTLQVTTQFSGGAPLKTPRTGTFHTPLTVI